MEIKKRFESIIWTNPNPVLRSRHSYFPSVCELDDGELLASHVIAEAFESVDGTTRISESIDQGRTWTLRPVAYDKRDFTVPTTDTMKLTSLGNGNLLLFGYEFFRNDPEAAIGNAVTGGLLDDRILFLSSSDNGQNWTGPKEVPCWWGRHAEASAPILVLQSGDWVSPIAEFPKEDGSDSGESCGRLLRSADKGASWSDEAVTMRLGDGISIYEQRICQLERSGNLVVIAWNENLKTGERLNNHYSISHDDGKTFDGPFDTGIRGQASSVCAIGEDRLLSLHARRRDTDRPGIYAYIVNLGNGKWEIESETLLWEPTLPITKNANMAEVFSFLKFGQPGARRLSDGSILATHWFIENGQGQTMAMRLELE